MPIPNENSRRKEPAAAPCFEYSVAALRGRATVSVDDTERGPDSPVCPRPTTRSTGSH